MISCKCGIYNIILPHFKLFNVWVFNWYDGGDNELIIRGWKFPICLLKLIIFYFTHGNRLLFL